MSSPVSPALRLMLAAGLLWAAVPGAALPAWAANAPTKIPATPAKPPTTPTLDALLKEAVERSPGVRAAKERYEAARARVPGQGLRPDPMVEGGVMSLWGLMGPEVSVSQTFPLGGKLETERQMAESEVAVAHQAYRAALNELLAEVKRAYYDLYFYQQSAAIVERNKQLLTQLAKIANARYAVGQGKQSDVLRINTQLAEVMNEAVLVRQQLEGNNARLLGLLNRKFDSSPKAMAPIPSLKAVPFNRPVTEILKAAESRNPAILQAQAALVAGEAALASARTISTPDVTTKLGVAQAYMGMGWETVVSGMVGTNIPVSSRQREAAAVGAAETELAARRSGLEDQRRAVTAGVHRYLADIRNLAERVRLYELGLLPQARQALQSELANYQVGRSDFDAVLTAQLNLYRYERDLQQAIADYQKALVEIEALTAEGLPSAVDEASAVPTKETP
ncbi:outer membrane channel protein [compost metagenome]